VLFSYLFITPIRHKNTEKDKKHVCFMCVDFVFLRFVSMFFSYSFSMLVIISFAMHWWIKIVSGLNDTSETMFRRSGATGQCGRCEFSGTKSSSAPTRHPDKQRPSVVLETATFSFTTWRQFVVAFDVESPMSLDCSSSVVLLRPTVHSLAAK